MREDGIGRVLMASLHQSIAETIPTRLPFYENWLSEGGLREGTIGLAPTYAVLSFLRQEGDYYDLITRKAGAYAAEWTVESLPAYRRSLIRRMPIWIRARMLAGLMDDLVRTSYAGSRAVGKVRKGNVRIDLRGSIFCTVREPVDFHLCGFYAAACTRLMALFGLEAETAVESCRGNGAENCVLTAAVFGPAAETHAESAGSAG